MSDFDDFLKEALKEAVKIAKDGFSGLKDDIEADAQAFLDRSKNKLSMWTTGLATGALTAVEFADLVEGQKTLAKMHAITAAGRSLAEAQRIRDAIIDAVIKAAIAAFL